MRLTWFGGTTVRVHIGGAMLVTDPEAAAAGIDRAELVSGADRVVAGFGADLPGIDPSIWRPRRIPRVVDGDAVQAVEIWRAGDEALLVDAAGEAPLLMLAGTAPALGRWAGDAIVVLFGDGEAMIGTGRDLLEKCAPRLLALAGDDAAVEATIAALRKHLDGTGLVSLEAGLALET